MHFLDEILRSSGFMVEVNVAQQEEMTILISHIYMTTEEREKILKQENEYLIEQIGAIGATPFINSVIKYLRIEPSWLETIPISDDEIYVQTLLECNPKITGPKQLRHLLEESMEDRQKLESWFIAINSAIKKAMKDLRQTC